MTAPTRALAIVLIGLCLQGRAFAAAPDYEPSDVPPEALREYVASVDTAGPHRPSPRLVGTAVMLNLVYIPTRLALTTLVAVLGGLTGMLTFGDEHAADSIFALANGPQVITPEMLDGTERWHLGAYD